MAITVETALDRRMITAIIASSLGFSLDLFDLFILLYVAPAVGKAFFPSDIATLSLAAVYASFAVTLMMRPIGSALFGNYADRHGRKGTDSNLSHDAAGTAGRALPHDVVALHRAVVAVRAPVRQKVGHLVARPRLPELVSVRHVAGHECIEEMFRRPFFRIVAE